MEGRNRIGGLAVFLLALGGPAASGEAVLTVAGVISDHVVVQRGVPVPVWGTAAPGAPVAVEFGGKTYRAATGEDGCWEVALAPQSASATGRSLRVRSGGSVRVVHDVVVGEVWLASGQSNMQFSLAACAKRLEAMRAIVEDPRAREIRVLRVESPAAASPARELAPPVPRWSIDSSAERARYSALAYLFARRLHDELRVPIGIIDSSWGGKPIEGFIPRAEFERVESLRPLLALADAGRLEELKRIEGGVFVRNEAGLPGRIFNGRLAPLVPFAVRGAIWYQGESNAGTAEDPRHYRHKMEALVDGWRRAWKQPAMPFYFVQLPSYRDEAFGWTRLREEQRRSLAIPHTGMAVTIDLHDADIHPANKLDVAERLARWPLAQLHERTDLPFSGPLFREAEVEGDAMRIRFAHAEGGLMKARKEGLEPPVETPEVPLGEFELAGASGTWQPAVATIEGAEVVVRCEAVPDPVAVRYACRGAPTKANLYNRAGLPASPFCSRLAFLRWEDPAGAR